MLTVYVTLVGIFLQARQVQLHLDNCLQKTTSCPESKQRWEKRSKDFNCTHKDTNYTCLLNKKGQLVETCIHKIEVEEGVVGCPFIMLCLDGLPQVGTENNYMECPEHIRWCPPKDHELYTLYEMYKYPACFYHNKSEAIHFVPPATETAVPISQTTYRIDTAESHTTQGSFPVFIVVIIAIIVLVIVVVALIVWFKRYRGQMSPSSEDGEDLPLMDRAIPHSIRVKFVEDSQLEVIWDAPLHVSNTESYYIYRKRKNQTDWELLHTDNSTRTRVSTSGIPIEEAVYYGVAAGQNGKITSTEYPMSENMLKEKGYRRQMSPSPEDGEGLPLMERYRRQMSQSSEDGEGLPLMDRAFPHSIRVKFVEDSQLEVIWDAPLHVSNTESYNIYRKRKNQTDWELLHADNSTRTRVFTSGIPIEEAVYYGVAAGQNGKITSTEYPMSENMLKEKEKKGRYLEFQKDLYDKNNERTKKIPIPSLRRATKVHIDNLYSSVVVRTDKSHQGTKGIKAREIEQRVEHPRDIFYIGDKRTRYAFMIGLPARGKTAYCQWLTHKWCTARQKRQEQEDLDEWEQGLNEFDFLFFVQLRNISKADSVSDMICSDLFPNDSESCIFINKILDSDDSRCLIIFDGLDELKSDCTLPDMDKMPNCTFFISTRPWKFDDISHLIDDNDKVLEIKGLDENGIKNVTESLLCHHYKLSKDSEQYVRLNDIITRKSRIGAIKTFMHIPLLAITCVQVLYEHRDEGDIGTNVTDFYMDMIDLLIKRAREKEHIHYDSDGIGCSEFAELLTYRNTNLYQYSEVLMRLAELAFEGLTGKKDKLIMNEDDLLRRISRNHLQFALDVGLLSQSDENAFFNKVKVSISFFHKTVQEAFSAMHIAVNIKEKFTNYLTNVKEILEYSYVIMFISGLKPDLGRYMLQHIADVLDKDAKISEYRSELLDTTDRSDISSLFKLQVDCFREIHYKMKATEEDKTNTQTAIPSKQSYFVSDVMLEDYDDDFISDTAELLGHHLPTLKSAYFLRVPSRGKTGIDDALITKFLDNTETLKSLFISGFEQGRILHHLRVSELTVLSLMYVSISDVNPVDETYSLEPLLKNMHSLQILKLNHVTVGNKDLGINAEFRQLKKIVLQWVKMSLWDRFFRSLTEVQHRYEVKLSYSDADDLSMEKLYKSPHFQITWYGGKARTHFYRIKQTLH